MSKPVFVPLALWPWTKFTNGSKTVELRNAKSPVARQVMKDPTPGRPVVLSHGYGKAKRMNGTLGEVLTYPSFWDLEPAVKVAAGLDDHHDAWAFLNPDEPVVAFTVNLPSVPEACPHGRNSGIVCPECDPQPIIGAGRDA